MRLQRIEHPPGIVGRLNLAPRRQLHCLFPGHVLASPAKRMHRTRDFSRLGRRTSRSAFAYAFYDRPPCFSLSVPLSLAPYQMLIGSALIPSHFDLDELVYAGIIRPSRGWATFFQRLSIASNLSKRRPLLWAPESRHPAGRGPSRRRLQKSRPTSAQQSTSRHFRPRATYLLVDDVYQSCAAQEGC